MLGYVHLLPETRPALERRTVAGTALWVLEGDLDGGLLPRRRLRRWTRRLAECGVSHAALPPGREAEFAPIRPVLPDGLRLALLPRLLDCLAPAGDTALLLADRADSRTLCAARVLAERFRHLRLSVGPGQEALERQLLRQLGLCPAGTFHLSLRQLGLTTGGGAAAVTVTFGPQAREGCAVYLTPDCARRQRVDYIWRDGESPAPEEPLLAALHRAGRLPDVGVKSAETLDIGP